MKRHYELQRGKLIIIQQFCSLKYEIATNFQEILAKTFLKNKALLHFQTVTLKTMIRLYERERGNLFIIQQFRSLEYEIATNFQEILAKTFLKNKALVHFQTATLKTMIRLYERERINLFLVKQIIPFETH